MASKKKKLKGLRSVVQRKTIPPGELPRSDEAAEAVAADSADDPDDSSDSLEAADDEEPITTSSSDDIPRQDLSRISQSLPVEPLHPVPVPTIPPGPASGARHVDDDNERPTPVSVPLPERAPIPERASVAPSAAVSSPPTVTLPPRPSVAPPPPTTPTSISEPGVRLSRPPAPAPAEDMPVLDANTIYTGELLRKVREARGVTLKEISQKTRIGVQSLAAIEEERFDDLPNARIYVRGFVRAEAAELAIDADQVEKTYLRRWDVWAENQRAKMDKTRLR